jgi:hypothetical protein
MTRRAGMAGGVSLAWGLDAIKPNNVIPGAHAASDYSSNKQNRINDLAIWCIVLLGNESYQSGTSVTFASGHRRGRVHCNAKGET